MKNKKRIKQKRRIPSVISNNPKSIRRFLNRYSWGLTQRKISLGRNRGLKSFLRVLKKDINNKMSLGTYTRFFNY